MLDEIGSVDNIDTYIKKAKDKDDPFRIMGFVMGLSLFIVAGLWLDRRRFVKFFGCD